MIDRGSYSLFVDFKDSNVFMINEVDEEELYRKQFLGQALPEGFQLPKFELIGSRKKNMRDFMYGRAQSPILSQGAHDALFDLIHKYVQFISIGKFKGSNYYLLNVLKVVDALDEKLSGVAYSEDDPERVIDISKYVLKPDAVNEVPIFKIPQSLNRVFVTRSFVDTIIEHKLSGVFVENPEKMKLSKATPLFGLPFK